MSSPPVPVEIRAVASVEVVKPLFDLLTSMNNEPVVEFTDVGLYATVMSENRVAAYEVRLSSDKFVSYHVSPESVYVRLNSYEAKTSLRNKKVEDVVTFSTEQRDSDTYLMVDGERVGDVAEKPSHPDFDTFLMRLMPPSSQDWNKLTVNAAEFRSFLLNAERAGAVNVAVFWLRDRPKIYAFAESVKIEFTHIFNWTVKTETKQAYYLSGLLALMPSSAIAQNTQFDLYGFAPGTYRKNVRIEGPFKTDYDTGEVSWVGFDGTPQSFGILLRDTQDIKAILGQVVHIVEAHFVTDPTTNVEYAVFKTEESEMWYRTSSGVVIQQLREAEEKGRLPLTARPKEVYNEKTGRTYYTLFG